MRYFIYIMLTGVFCFLWTRTLTAQTIPTYVPKVDLAGWWPFTGNAKDSSSNGNNGIVSGASLATDRFGKLASAYSFNGNGNHIKFNSKFIFHNSTDASISIWLNPATITNTANQATYLKSALTSSQDYNRYNFFWRTTQGLLLDYRSNSSNMGSNLHNLNRKPTLDKNTWIHVVYVRKGNVYKLYINGEEFNSVTDSNPNLPTATGWLLGDDPCANVDFAGLLDDLGLWKRALTDCEVYQLYKSSSTASSFSDSMSLCMNDSIQLTALPGYASYTWSNNKTTRSIYVSKGGNFSLIRIDSFGCPAYDTFTIQLSHPELMVMHIDSVSCHGAADGWIATKASGGIQPYSWLWSDGQKNDTAINLKKGNYAVTMIDAMGCKDDTTLQIEEPPEVATIDLQIDSVNCFGGSDGQIIANSTWGNKPHQWLWSDGQITASASNLKKGSYRVTLTDAKGCKADTIVMVEEPSQLKVDLVFTDSVSCFGGSDGSLAGSVTGGDYAYTKYWSNGETSDTLHNLRSGAYTLLARDASGCVDSVTGYVKEPAKLIASVLVSDSVSCHGGKDGSVTVVATGGNAPYTYLWPGFPNSSKVNGLAKGSYKVVVVDQYGCTDSVNTVVFEPYSLVASVLHIDSVSCAGYGNGAILAGAAGGTAPYKYQWNTSPSQMGAKAINLNKGYYIVTVTDQNGCSDTVSATVFENNLAMDVEIIAKRYVIKGDKVELKIQTPQLSWMKYKWTPNELFGNSDTSANPKVQIMGSTIIKVEMSNGKGCKGTDTALITVLLPLEELLPNAFTPNSDHVNDLFGLPSMFEVLQFDIFNRWGEMIFSGTESNKSWDGTYKGELVPIGTYLYVARARFRDTGTIMAAKGIIDVIY